MDDQQFHDTVLVPESPPTMTNYDVTQDHESPLRTIGPYSTQRPETNVMNQDSPEHDGEFVPASPAPNVPHYDDFVSASPAPHVPQAHYSVPALLAPSAPEVSNQRTFQATNNVGIIDSTRFTSNTHKDDEFEATFVNRQDALRRIRTHLQYQAQSELFNTCATPDEELLSIPEHELPTTTRICPSPTQVPISLNDDNNQYMNPITVNASHLTDSINVHTTNVNDSDNNEYGTEMGGETMSDDIDGNDNNNCNITGNNDDGTARESGTEPHDIDEFSTDAKALLGKRIPKNTVRASQSPINKLAIFMAQSSNSWSDEELDILKNYRRRHKDRPALLEKAIFNMRKELFSDGQGGILPNGYNEWSPSQLKNMNKILIEFFTYLHNGNEVESAKSFACYLDGLQRGFKLFYKFNIQIRNGEIFNDTDTGLFHVVDNICKDKQADGKFSASHNVLTKEDIFTLYDSDSLSKKTPLGFLTRIIFNLALSTTWRPGMLHNIDISDIKTETHKGEQVYRIKSRIATANASKCEKGGLNAVNDKPSSVTIWRRFQLNGQLCIFDDIKEYLDMTSEIHQTNSKFFLSVNYFGSTDNSKKRNFFKRQNLGEGTISKYVKEACDSVGVVGEGVRDQFTAHGLRATCITFLFEAGHQMQVIARKSGHRDPRSALSYHNTQGVLGQKLQADMFGENVPTVQIGVGSSPSCKRSLEDPNPNATKSVRFKTTEPCKSAMDDFNTHTDIGNDHGESLHGSSKVIAMCQDSDISGSAVGHSMSLFAGLRNVQSLTVNVYQNTPSKEGANISNNISNEVRK